ncbi:unnamed protein product [Urochloa humidicola]
MAAARRLDLPVVDLASADLHAAAKSIRQACVEYGFFYVINHGVERAPLEEVFAESRKFFEQTMEEKMALRKNSSHRGYTAPYSEKVDDLPNSRGSFCWFWFRPVFHVPEVVVITARVVPMIRWMAVYVQC